MTNIDTELKSRDVTLPTKVRIVKAMVLTVVMYGCENWTIKKTECQRINAFELWCWRRLLSPLDSKEIKPVNLKRYNPDYSLEGLMLKLKLQDFGQLMQTVDSLHKSLIMGKIEAEAEEGARG